MRVFSQTAAEQFCALAGPAPSVEIVADIVDRNAGRRLHQGTPEFEAYRFNVLREAEEYYYQAVSAYRRVHQNLMTPSGAFWAHVTLYYSSWYAAHAILNIFGAWFGLHRFVEV